MVKENVENTEEGGGDYKQLKLSLFSLIKLTIC